MYLLEQCKVCFNVRISNNNPRRYFIEYNIKQELSKSQARFNPELKQESKQELSKSNCKARAKDNNEEQARNPLNGQEGKY